jgi:hypothetical protein
MNASGNTSVRQIEPMTHIVYGQAALDACKRYQDKEVYIVRFEEDNNDEYEWWLNLDEVPDWTAETGQNALEQLYYAPLISEAYTLDLESRLLALLNGWLEPGENFSTIDFHMDFCWCFPDAHGRTKTTPDAPRLGAGVLHFLFQKMAERGWLELGAYQDDATSAEYRLNPDLFHAIKLLASVEVTKLSKDIHQYLREAAKLEKKYGSWSKVDESLKITLRNREETLEKRFLEHVFVPLEECEKDAWRFGD